MIIYLFNRKTQFTQSISAHINYSSHIKNQPYQPIKINNIIIEWLHHDHYHGNVKQMLAYIRHIKKTLNRLHLYPFMLFAFPIISVILRSKCYDEVFKNVFPIG